MTKNNNLESYSNSDIQNNLELENIVTHTSLKIKFSSLLPQSLVSFLILTIGLIALSLTAIFIKFALVEISPQATVFNRLWIAFSCFY